MHPVFWIGWTTCYLLLGCAPFFYSACFCENFVRRFFNYLCRIFLLKFAPCFLSRGEWFAVFRIWVFEAIYVRWFYMVLCRIFAWRFLSDFYGRFEFCFFSFGDCILRFFCSIFEFLYQQILRISRFLKMCFFWWFLQSRWFL